MKVRFLSGDTATNDIFCVFKVFYSAIITDKFLIMRRMLVLHLFDAFQYKNHWCMSVWSTSISLNTWDINGQRMAETHHMKVGNHGNPTLVAIQYTHWHTHYIDSKFLYNIHTNNCPQCFDFTDFVDFLLKIGHFLFTGC